MWCSRSPTKLSDRSVKVRRCVLQLRPRVILDRRERMMRCWHGQANMHVGETLNDYREGVCTTVIPRLSFLIDANGGSTEAND